MGAKHNSGYIQYLTDKMPSVTAMRHCGAVPCWHLQPFPWATFKSCRENMKCNGQSGQTQWSLYDKHHFFQDYILECLHQQYLFCKELGDKQNFALGVVAVAKTGTKLQCHKSEIMSHTLLLNTGFVKTFGIHASTWACCSGYHHIYG